MARQISQEEMRLITKVAMLYHEQGKKQKDIAGHLDISQATVSRLIERARHLGVVKISITAPGGVYPELEEKMESTFGLKDAIVVESASNEEDTIEHIGRAAAYYLESTLKSEDVVGLSSWSDTLLAMANEMHPIEKARKVRVVQILGGVGSPTSASHATQLTQQLASLVGGEATLLPAPGVVGSNQSRDVLLADPFVNQAMRLFDQVTVALVGIGSVEPSPVLAQSGNVFPKQALDDLRSCGAVGDILLRFFDKDGKPVQSTWNDRVVGMELKGLEKAKRSIGVAGGDRKVSAILGALRGGFLNVLITDEKTATAVIENNKQENAVSNAAL